MAAISCVVSCGTDFCFHRCDRDALRAGFSKQNIIKSMLRTHVDDATLDTLMRLSMADDDGVGLDDFDFDAALAKWSSAARGR